MVKHISAGSATRRKNSAKLMFAIAGLLSAGTLSSSAQWSIKTYDNSPLLMVNYAAADALIAGKQLQGGAPITNAYTLTNVNDNGDGPGWGSTTPTQIIGLPAATDNNDFAFVGKGTATVNVTGAHFTNNTDDGSRLRASINGSSRKLSPTTCCQVVTMCRRQRSLFLAGTQISFDWMWYERNGVAHGNVSYTRDGGTRVVVGDSSQGLSLNGGTFQGSLYKSTVTGTVVDSLATANSLVTPANLKGSALLPTFNISNSGGDGHFAGGVQPPGYDTSDHDNYVTKGTGFLHVAVGGVYNFASLSDDGARNLSLRTLTGN